MGEDDVVSLGQLRLEPRGLLTTFNVLRALLGLVAALALIADLVPLTLLFALLLGAVLSRELSLSAHKYQLRKMMRVARPCVDPWKLPRQ